MARGAAAPARRTRTSGADVQHAPARRAPKRRVSGPARGRAHAAAPARKAKPRNAAAPARKAPARKAPATRPRVVRPAPAGAPLATRLARAPFVSTLRWRGGGVLDALLAGSGWIVLVGALLVGVVFFNVGLLELNRGITQTSEKVADLKRENSRLRLEEARLGSSERIQTAAAAEGLVLPAPGDVRYLSINPSVDARRAARRVVAPESVALVAPPAPVEPALTTTPTDPTIQETPPATTVEPQAAPETTVPPATTAPEATTPPAGTPTTGTPTG